MLAALITAVAIVVAALLVVLSQLGGGGPASGGEVGRLYSGIPQEGTTLGKSGAPVTICLYEDFQCPYCGQFSPQTFPRLVDGYVRDGKVVSETTTLKSRTATGLTPLLFEEQQESSGYVTRDFLEDLARKTPGLDVDEWNAQLTNGSFDSELEAARSKAQTARVSSTPTLILSGPGGQRELVGLRNHDEVSQAVDQVDGS